MELRLHGENGITFSLFSELDTELKLVNFLKIVEWNNKPNLINLQIEYVDLFPNFGSRGRGRPDSLIISDKYLFNPS